MLSGIAPLLDTIRNHSKEKDEGAESRKTKKCFFEGHGLILSSAMPTTRRIELTTKVLMNLTAVRLWAHVPSSHESRACGKNLCLTIP